MKKIVIVLTAILVSIACEKEKKGYVISADVQGFEDGVKVYVNGISQSNRPTIIDSSTIKDSKFEIVMSTPAANDLNYLTFDNTNGNVLYVAEDVPIKMTIYKDSLRSSVIKGGAENDLFFNYLTKVTTINREKQELRNQYQIATKLKKTDEAAELSIKQQQLIVQEKELRRSFVDKNPTSLVAVMVLTDMVNLKSLAPKKVKKLFTTLDNSVKTSRLGKNLDRILASSVGKIDIGSEIDDFEAPNPEGQLVSLKQSMGKVTIIDFWASWCKPCRVENPNVVRVYNKYHDKGLNIIGVSLDRNKEHWQKAITADHLDWNHVSNLKFWQEPIAKAFGVRSIPATFIIDENGNVIDKNLRGPALETRIAELLEEKAL